MDKRLEHLIENFEFEYFTSTSVSRESISCYMIIEDDLSFSVTPDKERYDKHSDYWVIGQVYSLSDLEVLIDAFFG